MALWMVVTGRAGVPLDWPDVRVIARSTSIGGIQALVEADEAAIAAVRADPGVASVEPAKDAHEHGDGGAIFEVHDGGQRYRRLP